MIHKFDLPTNDDAKSFASEVIQNGGDAYQWYQTSTVVVRGDIPKGHKLHELPNVTDFDRLMLNNIGWDQLQSMMN